MKKADFISGQRGSQGPKRFFLLSGFYLNYVYTYVKHLCWLSCDILFLRKGIYLF